MRMVVPEYTVIITYGMFEDGTTGVDWVTDDAPPVLLLGMLETVKQDVAVSGWGDDAEARE